MIPTTSIERLTLGNIHPGLNDRFNDALRQVTEHFQDESDRLNKEVREGEITIKLKFKHVLETRATSVEATVSAKLPGYRSCLQAIRLAEGAEYPSVEVDKAVQLDAFVNRQIEEASR